MNTGSPRSVPQSIVLVVEDETIIRMLLVEDLESAGRTVIEAENADVAMAVLLENPDIGIVVTDVRMPGSIDGMGLAAWMREHRPAVPIVITSGFATMPDIDAINPAIARVIAKPYRTGDVTNYLASLGPVGSQGMVD